VVWSQLQPHMHVGLCLQLKMFFTFFLFIFFLFHSERISLKFHYSQLVVVFHKERSSSFLFSPEFLIIFKNNCQHFYKQFHNYHYELETKYKYKYIFTKKNQAQDKTIFSYHLKCVHTPIEIPGVF
jgi:hypothetical protein